MYHPQDGAADGIQLGALLGVPVVGEPDGNAVGLLDGAHDGTLLGGAIGAGMHMTR